MAEYIDRKAFLGHMKKTNRYFDVKHDIENFPTADVAPVVRCKDCKHYEIHKPKVLENCERNGHIIPMKPDDFCAYGERKDGDD